MQKKLIIFSAPSGAGKTTLVNYLLKKNPDLAFSISACSREKRPHEIDGRDYYFLSSAEFRKKINNNEFVEWEEVYPGHFYGTLRSEIERIWSKGKNVIFDVDVIGGMNIKRRYGDRALAVFVMPPSIEELERRLLGRSTENADALGNRLAKAESEMEYATDFDLTLVNDNLEKAKQEAMQIVKKFLSTNGNTLDNG